MKNNEREMWTLNISAAIDMQNAKTRQEGYIIITNMETNKKELIMSVIKEFPEKKLFIRNKAYDICGREIQGMFALCQEVNDQEEKMSQTELFMKMSTNEDLGEVIDYFKSQIDSHHDLSLFWDKVRFETELREILKERK